MKCFGSQEKATIKITCTNSYQTFLIYRNTEKLLSVLTFNAGAPKIYNYGSASLVYNNIVNNSFEIEMGMYNRFYVISDDPFDGIEF